MSYEKFKKELQEELDNRNITEAKIVININNDTSPQLEVVNSHDIPLVQIPDLNFYYKMYKIYDVSIHDISNMLEMLIIKSGFTFEALLMTDWDIAKRHVLPQMMNTAKNIEYLKLVPHREVLDMSVVYYIEMESADKDVMGKFVVPYSIFKCWNISEEQLYNQAMNNMNSSMSPVFDDLDLILRSLPGICTKDIFNEMEDFDTGFYVLTNTKKFYGSAYILVTDILDAISRILMDDLIICPSSVHEVLIRRKNDGLTIKELTEIVKEVNNSAIKDNDILSYSVYEFSGNQLKIAA